MSEFKYLYMFLDELGTDEAECCTKVVSGMRVARVLHETLLVPVLMYGSETVIWKERSRIRPVQMDSLRGLLDIKRMDRVPNAWIKELWFGKGG